MIIIWLSEIMFLKLWLLTLVCLHFCVKFGCTVLHGLRLCKILVLASKQIDVCDGHLQLRLWFSFTALTLLLLIIIAPLYLADVCQRVPRDTVFARLLTGISWSCDPAQQNMQSFPASAPTTGTNDRSWRFCFNEQFQCTVWKLNCFAELTELPYRLCDSHL